jgi:oligosaccharide repeat unit polymerase
VIALYTFIHASLLILAGFLWMHESGRRIVITPFILFVLVEIVFSWNYWLLFQKAELRVTPGAVVLSMAATASFLTGHLFLTACEEIRTRGKGAAYRLKRYLERPTLAEPPAVRTVMLLCLLTIGIAAGLAFHRKTPPAVEGALALIQEGNLESAHTIVGTGRREVTKSHVFGNDYRGQGLFKSFTLISWAYGLTLSILLAVTEARRRWRCFVLIFFAGLCYFVAGSGERSHFIWALIVATTGLSFLVPMGLKKILVAGLVLVLFMVILTVLLPRYQLHDTRHRLIGKIVSSVADRIATGNKINNVRLMNLIEKGRFRRTYGSEHRDLFLNVLPGIHRPPLGHRLGEALGSKKTTYYSGTYLGTVYIDFGMVGVGVVYAVLGAFASMAFHRLLLLPKRLMNITFMALVIYKIGYMSISGGVISFLSGMVPILFVHLSVLSCTLLPQPARRPSGSRGSRP